jgi:hypothetical protein
MKRFVDGKGELLDLEFLNDDNGRRIAAFGHSAGFAGMGVGLLVWCHQQLMGYKEKYPSLFPYNSKQDFISEIQTALGKVKSRPTVLIIGALGRCGKGSVEVCKAVGLEPIQWDLDETKGGGPFKQLLNVDILINDIYLMGKIPSFLTKEMISTAGESRKLSVFVDVSCDATNVNNPYPIYEGATNFSQPTVRVADRLDVVAIDHLPSLIPRESSEDFGNSLIPHLIPLKDVNFDSEEKAVDRIWIRARKLFQNKVKELSNSSTNEMK